MAPQAQAQQEDSPLLNRKDDEGEGNYQKMEFASQSSSFIGDINTAPSSSSWIKVLAEKVGIIGLSALAVFVGHHGYQYVQIKTGYMVPTGPYKLVQAQEGNNFFSFYDFYDGPDSLGSAGYNTYVSEQKAKEQDIATVTTETDPRTGEDVDFVYMSSAPTKEGPRDSVRLEGKKRFDRGLFILDVRHMPDGAGVWPAFWMTDEAVWPRNGEVDILEGAVM